MLNDNWALKTAIELTGKGYRCIPAKDGKPLFRWKDGQEYRNIRYWHEANQVALVLDRALLVDWDNGETSLDALRAITSDSIATATQWRREGDKPSYHWLYALPDGITADTHKCSQDGTFLPGVDLKMLNQLCYLKPDKIQNIPPLPELPPAPAVLLDAMKRTAKEQSTRATRLSGEGMVGADRTLHPYAWQSTKSDMSNIKACAKASPVYWYSRLLARINEAYRGACPSCGGVDRCHFQSDTGRWACRVCGQKGSIIDYAALVKRIPIKQAVDGLASVMRDV